MKSDLSVFIIAEAGVNHNGSAELALDMIDVAAGAGADAVKFQTFSADAITTKFAEKAEYQKETTGKKQSQQEMLRSLELPEESYVDLVKRCDEKGIEFMSTAFDIESLNFLIKLGIQRIKIPSGELTNVPLLRHIAKQKLPVILSTGMADLAEVFWAVDILCNAGLNKSNLTILHCNTAYPTPFEDANLACIDNIKSNLNCEVGYSDHTLGDTAVIAAVALGAKVVEKHYTLDKTMPGPDQACSLEPNELGNMVTKIRQIELALGNGIKQPTASEKANTAVARKSIVASRRILKGEIFNEGNLTTKRPATGVSAAQWDNVVGREARRDYKEDEQVEFE